MGTGDLGEKRSRFPSRMDSWSKVKISSLFVGTPLSIYLITKLKGLRHSTKFATNHISFVSYYQMYTGSFVLCILLTSLVSCRSWPSVQLTVSNNSTSLMNFANMYKQM